MVRPGKDVRVRRVDSHVVASLQEELQTGFTVRGEDQGLHSSTFTLDPDSREVRKHQALEG